MIIMKSKTKKEKINQPKETGTIMNLSLHSIEKIDNSECKHCYHSPECILKKIELKKCKRWLDKRNLNNNRKIP